MKKKVLRERRHNKEVILNKLADELVKEIVEEAKPKKRASKKKEG